MNASLSPPIQAASSLSDVSKPRLSPARMYDRLLAGDATWNGRFFTGVLTTGIYCLPSCKARKPKLENVRFFPSCEAARAFGLRACKKCLPDDFARGADPVLETIETVVAEVRTNPDDFCDARAVVRRTGFGVTRALELFRQHFQTTPADVLLRARIAAAKTKLLSSDSTLAEIAFASGFESLSTFHANFHRLNGLTPALFRALRNGNTFTVSLPLHYPEGYLRHALSRDPHSVSERLAGDTYTCALLLGNVPHLLTLRFASREISAEITPDGGGAPTAPVHSGILPRTHALVVGLLGLDQNATAFAKLARKQGLGQLVEGREELRISQTLSIFDGLLWSIIGQQINFPFACLLRRRLIEKTGRRVRNGLFAPPAPSDVAALSPSDLLSLQFSRQKAEYVIATSRRVVANDLDLESLPLMSSTRAERTLLAVRGLGPWAVNYLMMRSLGFSDCVPLGDTGVTNGLQSLLELAERPDVDTTRRLMERFSPYRSLATTHLWQYNRPLPE